MRRIPFGTAQTEVLLRITNPKWCDGAWAERGSPVLYENRAMTQAVCQSLAAHGLLDERIDGTSCIYTVNPLGQNKANQLRGLH